MKKFFKKIIIFYICMCISVLFNNVVFASASVQSVDVYGFISSVKEYSSDIFPEIADEKWLNNILKGELKISSQTIIKRIFNIFVADFEENIGLLLKILGITFLCAILKNIQSSFGGTVSEIAFYVCYMLIVVLIVTSFTNIISICLKSINKLNRFMNLLIPVLITLLVSMGNIATVATIQPVLLGMISIISILISNLIIPIILISTILNLISNISSQVNVEKLGKFFKKSVMYILEFVMIIFLGVLSLEGTLTSSVDGITAKIAKTAVSNVVPVVGKLISDATDSVIGGVSITKNAVGVIGILVITLIVIGPIVKAFILMMLFNLTSAVCDTIADSRISKCMTITADSIKLIFGIMIMVLFLFIIAITLMIKISNFSLMYR